MKKNLPACIMDAMSQIAKCAMIEHDNGTHGETFHAWMWDTERTAAPERKEIMAQIMKVMNSGMESEAMEKEIKRLEKELEKYPQKTVFCLKLEKPINALQGTKVLKDGSGKNRILFMPTVTEIYIHQDILLGGFVEIEELKRTKKSIGGAEHPVLKVKLSKSLLEVTEEMYDFKDKTKIYREKRAMVSNISYRTMQALGKMVQSMENMDTRLQGWATQEDFYAYLNQSSN